MARQAQSQPHIYLAHDSEEPPAEIIDLLNLQPVIVDAGPIVAHTPAIVGNGKTDLVIMVQARPGSIPLELCQKVRAGFQVPLLVLTGLYSEKDHIHWLTLGADDVLAMPPSPPLFIAKVHALLRGMDFGREHENHLITFGDLTVDTHRRTVMNQGRDAMLTDIEYEIFSYLVKNSGRVVSRNDVHLALYNSEHNGYDRYLDIYISKIRHKIGDPSWAPKYVKTIRGTGYLFIGRND